MKRLATAMVAIVVALGLFPAAGAAYADLTTNPHPDGTYAVLDIDTAFGMPGLQRALDYFEPRIIVDGGGGTLMIATATYRYDYLALGTMEDLEADESIAAKGVPIYADTLTGNRGTDIKGYVFALPMTTAQLDEALDTGEGTLPFLVRYVEDYDSQYSGHWYQAEKAQMSFKTRRVGDSTERPELSADYSAVIEAIGKIPSDLSIYVPSSVQALNDALAAVDTSKKASEQGAVDAMAKALRAAISGLGEAADYTKVDEALALIPEDLSPYTTETARALFDAKSAVVRNYTIDRQSAVDKMAADIENALAGLVEQYVPVRDAIRALPLPKKVTVADEEAVSSAKRAYDGLSEPQQEKINKNLKKKLTNCVEALEMVKKAKAEADKREAEKKKKEEAAKREAEKKKKEEAAKREAEKKKKEETKNASDKENGKESGTTQRDSTEVRATAANSAAIAAALSGKRGTSASSGNSSTSKNNTATNGTQDKTKSKENDGKDTSAAKSEEEKKSEKERADNGKSDKDKPAEAAQADGASSSEGKAGDEGSLVEDGQRKAAMAASMPFFILGLVAAGIASFVAAFVYRNRRRVRVRF